MNVRFILAVLAVSVSISLSTNVPTGLLTERPSSSPTRPTPTPTKKPSTSPSASPTRFPTKSPTTKAPTQFPTQFPTNAPTPCTSSCPASQFNMNWRRDSGSQVCMGTSELDCRVCPSGSYKVSGSSWTPCEPCGNENFFCVNGIMERFGAGVCTYRRDRMQQFLNKQVAFYGGEIRMEFLKDLFYDESKVRDATARCGKARLLKGRLELDIVRPASSVTEVAVENIGELPVSLNDFKLPGWVSLFDPVLGREISSRTSIVVPGGQIVKLSLLVKSSKILDSEVLKDPKGATYSENQVSFSATQVAQNPSVAAQSLRFDLVVFVSEPSLSLLPSENTWTMNIGTSERRTLALYNMQVKDIEWTSSVRYYRHPDTADQNQIPKGWLEISPNSGSLVQGFECTNDGQVIGTNGTNKAEIVALVNGTNLKPGKYQAQILVEHRSQQASEAFQAVSTINLEVLPGEVQVSQTTFAWAALAQAPPSSNSSTSSIGGGNTLLTVGRPDRGLQLHDAPVSPFHPNTLGLPQYELHLPYTELEIFPRDSFGILTSQFPEDHQKHDFNITWIPILSSSEDSLVLDWSVAQTLMVSRNPVDNSFKGVLDIRQTGQYLIQITMEPYAENIKGSPFVLDALPLVCNDLPNAEPHPDTGYTCVCSAGYGKNEATGVCEPCPTGQYRDTSMLASTPFCRSCDLGMFQDEAGSQSCKFCPAGHQPNPSQSGCTACEDNHVVDTSSPSRSCVPCGSEFTVVNYECICRPEYYSGIQQEKACVSCPPGAFCGYGNRTTILPRMGYWRTSWDPLRFEKCPNPESCLGVDSNVEYVLRIPDAWERFINNPTNVSLSISDPTDEEDPYLLPVVQEMNGCAQGFTGPLCKECAPGYYPIGSTLSCFACDSRGRTVGFFILSVFFGVGALCYLVSRTIKAKGAPRRREVMVLKIVLSHLQIIAMTKKFPLAWPPLIASMMSIFDILSSAGSSALSTHCLFYSGPQDDLAAQVPFPFQAEDMEELAESQDDILDGLSIFGLSDWVFLARSLFYALAPIMLALFFVFLWKFVVPLYRDTSHDTLTAREKVIVSIIVLLIVLQPFLTRAGFEFFSCSEKIDERSFLEAQYTIQCWVGLHSDWIVLGALMLAVYAVGIPLYATLVLYCVVWRESLAEAKENMRNSIRQRFSSQKTRYSDQFNASSFDRSKGDQLRFRHQRMSSTSSSANQSLIDDDDLHVGESDKKVDALERWRPIYGFIYSGYRKECFFWEIVIMLRKGAFATVSVILRPIGVDIQTYTGLLVIVLSIVLHVHFRPYTESSRLHVVETTSLAICFLTLMCGLLIYSPNTSEVFKQVCTMTIILSNVVFFMFVLFSIRRTVVESIQMGWQMVTFWCCGKRSDTNQSGGKSDDDSEDIDTDNNQSLDMENGVKRKRSGTLNNNNNNNNSTFGEPSEQDYDADEEMDQESINDPRISADQSIGLSFKLQQAAETYRQQGDYEAAAKAAMQAADMALAALRREEAERSERQQLQQQAEKEKGLVSTFSASSLGVASQAVLKKCINSFRVRKGSNNGTAPQVQVDFEDLDAMPEPSLSLVTEDRRGQYEPLASRTPPQTPDRLASPPNSPSIQPHPSPGFPLEDPSLPVIPPKRLVDTKERRMSQVAADFLNSVQSTSSGNARLRSHSTSNAYHQPANHSRGPSLPILPVSAQPPPPPTSGDLSNDDKVNSTIANV